MPRQPTFLDIPRVDRRPWGWLGLALDLVPWGGVGSLVVGVHARHRPTIVIGILQALLTPFLLGYLWSISWGIGIFLRSRPLASESAAPPAGSRRRA